MATPSVWLSAPKSPWTSCERDSASLWRIASPPEAERSALASFCSLYASAHMIMNDNVCRIAPLPTVIGEIYGNCPTCMVSKTSRNPRSARPRRANNEGSSAGCLRLEVEMGRPHRRLAADYMSRSRSRQRDCGTNPPVAKRGPCHMAIPSTEQTPNGSP